MIEISDLGENLSMTILKIKKISLKDYKKLIELIIKLQKIKLKKKVLF